MKLIYKAGGASQLQRIIVQNSSTGNPMTGLVFNTSGLKWSYIREDQTTVTVVTPVAGTLGTWASGGFVEVDSTNFPGLYEIGLPNASLASGVSVQHTLFGVADMLPVAIELELTAVDLQDGVHFNLTSLPNAVAGANGGLPLGNASGNVTIAGYAANEDPATLVLNAVAASYDTSGTIGAKINASASAGDPWATALPGSYSAGEAGFIVGHNLNDPISTVVNTLGTPAGASVSADIATANSGIVTANSGITTANTGITSLANGNGLFVPGTVSTATSAGSFIVQFTGSAPPAAGLAGLFCCITSAARAPEKQQITTATLVDSTHLTLTFSTAFGVAPSVSDSVLIG